MKQGDIVEVEISRIGTLRNCVRWPMTDTIPA
jgi:fumarylacetoacetate (FAA) hydrolase family protein